MNNTLDYQEERQAIIEKIKNRLLELCDNKITLEWEHLGNYGSDSELIDYHLVDIEHEICERIQDYHQMLYDFKKDWDLNYDYY